jgi:hypothetical protein
VPEKQTFTASIQNAGGGGAFVEVPFDVKEVFGSERPKVRALIEGVSYRGTLVRMRGGHHMLIILKGIRERIGRTFGDEVRIVVEVDVEPRVVKIPADLMKEFKKDKAAKVIFDKLAYTHRREYVRWIDEAELRAFIAPQSKKSLQSVITYSNLSAETFHVPLWQMLIHLANHETHHRGELAAMFTLMNVPHPEDEVIQYFLNLSGQKKF